MKNKIMKLISVVLTLSLFLNVFLSMTAGATSKSDLQDKISAIEKEIESKKSKIDSLKGDISKQSEYVSTLYSEIDSIQEQIDLYAEKIDSINADITAANKKINAINVKINKKEAEIQVNKQKMQKKQDEIAEIKIALSKRIRATYMAGSASTLELLLSSDDLSSYLTTSEMLKRMADNDDKIVTDLLKKIEDCLKIEEELKAEQKELSASKEELKTQKAELEGKVDELKSEQKVYTDKQSEISVKYNEANNALQKLNSQSSAYKNQISKLQSQEAQIEQQIKDIITGGSSSTGGAGTNYSPTSNPKGYINPVPYGDAYISSGYGYRTNPVTGVYKLHSGIDISCGGSGGTSGPFTKRIVAAKSGTVSYAGWVSGYGNTVMITHSDGYLTLYGHNYQIKVSVGQKVSQGQQIAIMGSTGNSTGAHCHFEIRNGMWGTTMNPAPYI